MKRILLDENVPIAFRHFLKGEIETVQFNNWRGTRNGALLARASPDFDVLVTFDRGFEHEQNVQRFDIAVVLLDTTDSDLEFLVRHGEVIQAMIESAAPGQVYKLSLFLDFKGTI